MNIINRITREPVLLIGFVTAGLGLLVLFGVDLSKEQIGGIVTFLGTAMALLRAVVTPSSEVIVQEKPGELPKATKAATIEEGVVVDVIPAQ